MQLTVAGSESIGRKAAFACLAGLSMARFGLPTRQLRSCTPLRPRTSRCIWAPIYGEGELWPEATCKQFLQVRQGAR